MEILYIYQTKDVISISSGIKITYQEMVSYMNNNHLYVLSDKFDGANSKVDFMMMRDIIILVFLLILKIIKE